ncbi:hypothetical protein A33M_0022 [Rhodovulum sp. PH10]|uniref:glycosyltransferase family 39 protein n=1 Tax=Rhodovulum sp. PH10 TaxID=1187851 RepID=UPI00027C259B|nr:glycosyltransferase family 39 protein [Rhodovulum sp. PH10]EJW13692.1 hypothetical protein A33M_0022 [Rhodovulum sp. PH10]
MSHTGLTLPRSDPAPRPDLATAPARTALARGLRIADLLAVMVLIAVAVVVVTTFRDFGLGWDDYTHAEYGGLLMRLYGSGFTDRRALSFVNLYAYGGGFDMFAALVAKVTALPIFEARRLAGGLVGLAGLGITWRLARGLGGPLAGFIAVTLLAACPLYLGHMFMNPKDVPFAVAMLAATLGFVHAFSEYPKPSVPTIALLGLGLGLSFGTRVMGALAAMPAIAAFGLIVVVEARRTEFRAALRRAGVFVLRLLPALVIGYALMALIWPWSVVSPLNPLRALVYFSHFFEKPWDELFDGTARLVIDMPRTYVPMLLGLKLPEILWVLGVAGVVAALVVAMRRDGPLNRRASLVFLAVSVLFPVLFTVVTRPAMYNGVRHMLFVIPPLAILAGLVGALLIDRLGGGPARRALTAAVLLALGLAHPVAAMVRLHPYEYTYFNPIAGGVRGADGRFMLDYWGLSMKQASELLLDRVAKERIQPPPKHKWKVAVCGPERTVQVSLGPGYKLDWKPAGADFAISLAEFYCAKLDAPVIAEVTRDDVVYARVYDLRSHPVADLLTRPPP